MSYKITPAPEDWETEFERIKIHADEDGLWEPGWKCRTCGQVQRGYAPHGHCCSTTEVQLDVVSG